MGACRSCPCHSRSLSGELVYRPGLLASVVSIHVIAALLLLGMLLERWSSPR